MDNTVFPPIFELGGKTFQWIYNNKTEYVDFTLTDMVSPTGVFLEWQKYCQRKHKKKHAAKTRSK